MAVICGPSAARGVPSGLARRYRAVHLSSNLRVWVRRGKRNPFKPMDAGLTGQSDTGGYDLEPMKTL
jgi:hypothetical protein